MPTLADYLAKIPSANATKPKFMAVLAAYLQPFVDIEAVLASMPALFDLDVAVGDQLDTVGEWVGITREISAPIVGVYFSLDVEGLGLDQGYLQGKFDPTNGLVSLDDDHYRLLLRAKIAANNWDGTAAGAVAAIAQLQIPDTKIFFQDNQDMSVTLGIAGVLPDPVTLAILTGGYLALKPVTVRMDIEVTSVNGAPLFGLDVENANVSGLDVGALGVPSVAYS